MFFQCIAIVMLLTSLLICLLYTLGKFNQEITSSEKLQHLEIRRLQLGFWNAEKYKIRVLPAIILRIGNL